MSVERTKRPRRRRLTEDEHKLWSGVVRSIAPLKRKRPSKPPLETIVAAEPMPPPPVRRPAEAVPASPPRAKPATAVVKSPSTPPAVTNLDRKQKRRLARGVEAIEARIDLHGMTQSEAHAALLVFLRRAQAEGVRFVLVITGKGAASTEGSGRGVLKRQVPLWLRQAEFRAYVLAAEDAHRAHGGKARSMSACDAVRVLK